MTVWRIEAETEGREVYYVEADTEDEARTRWENEDNLPDPSVSEVLGATITSIEEVTDDGR